MTFIKNLKALFTTDVAKGEAIAKELDQVLAQDKVGLMARVAATEAQLKVLEAKVSAYLAQAAQDLKK